MPFVSKCLGKGSKKKPEKLCPFDKPPSDPKMCAKIVQDVLNMCARSVQGMHKVCARCAQCVCKIYAYVMFDIIEPQENIVHVGS